MNDSTVYHYTSYDALIKISESRTMWASNIRYLNDGSEFAYAHEVLGRVLASVRREEPRHDKLLTAVDQAVATDRTANVFVVSFSTEPDSLNQWRAYCPAARGVAIGIRRSRLKGTSDKQGFTLAKCVYDTDEQEQLVHALMAEFLADVEFGLARYELDFWAKIFTGAFRAHAPYLKHPAFAEEREWRLVSRELPINDERVRFRQGTSFVVPYCEYALPVVEGNLALDDVIVGPTPHPQLAYDSVLALLAAKRCDWVTLRASAVPFRAW